jgi:hypothetical protein
MEFEIGEKAICYPKVFDYDIMKWVVDPTHTKYNWKYNGGVVTIVGKEKREWGMEYKVVVDELNNGIGMSYKPYYYFDEEELKKMEEN